MKTLKKITYHFVVFRSQACFDVRAQAILLLSTLQAMLVQSSGPPVVHRPDPPSLVWSVQNETENEIRLWSLSIVHYKFTICKYF